MKELPETRDKEIQGLFRPKFGSRAVYDESPASKAEKAAREGISEADYSFVKIILVIISVSALAFLFGYSLSAWGAFPSAAAGILLVSAIVLLPLLLKAHSLHFVAGLALSLAMVAPLFFFGGIPLTPSAILAGVLTALLTEGVIYGKKELDNSLKASFTKFSRRIIARAFAVIALVVAISYGWHFKAEDLFSDWFIDGALSFSSPIVHYYAPRFTPEMKFGEFLAILAQRALAEQNGADFILMPETTKRELISRAVDNSRLVLENNLAVGVNLDASFRENFRKTVAEKIAKPAQTINPDHISAAAVIVIFIFVRGILWFFGWLALALAFFVFQLLLVTKFAEIYVEARTREIIVLK